MGTTLTGTTPQDTYDSLIKVTDNGPISATAKFLSDGLGNDSALALSTTQVGVGTNNPQGILHAESANANLNLIAPTGNSTFRISNSATSANRKEFTAILDTTNNRVDIQAIHQGVATLPITLNAGGGNVGIGTSAPTNLLDIQSTSATLRIRNTTAAPNAGTISKIVFEGINDFSGNSQTFINSIQAGNSGVTQLAFGTSSTGDATATERFRVTNNGVTFNGDTAAANALDDYEEGTWTPVDSSGGGLTFLQAVGTYTKIGREVFVRGFIQYPTTANVSAVILGGLPFTTTGGLAGRGGNVTYVDKTTMSYLITNTAATTMSAFNSAGVATTNANLSDAYLYFSANYNV